MKAKPSDSFQPRPQPALHTNEINVMKHCYRRQMILISCGLALGACAAALTTTEVETFEPQIFNDGTKTFRYTLDEQGKPKSRTYIELTDQRVEDLKQDNPAMPPEDRDQQRRDHRFLQLLDQKLEATGFCRQGYIEIESDLGIRTSWLRGECRESASTADRQRFHGTANP